MKSTPCTLLAAMILAFTLPGCACDEKTSERAPITRTDTVEVTTTSKVTWLNQATRVITLQDERGNEMTFAVSDRVQRLDEVRIGDNVKVQYNATLVAELRPPTPEEKANPISVTRATSRSPEGTTPAAARAQVITMVTTVEAVDVPNMLVTLRGPLGDLAVVHAKSEHNIKQLHVGDTIVISTTRTLAIALEKIAPR